MPLHRAAKWTFAIAALVAVGAFYLFADDERTPAASSSAVSSAAAAVPRSDDLPPQKILQNDYHVFQTFNNCGPAALSMALSYFGIRATQEQIADSVRPLHNLTGKNDDKATAPEELVAKAEKYGLVAYYRPNGTIQLLKEFIASDIPVVVRTLLHSNEDFAHYRVIKGYDDDASEIIDDDGYEGANVRFSYDDFLALWRPFNNGYIVLVPSDKREVAEAIMGEDADAARAWSSAAQRARQELAQRPDDVGVGLNLSVALYHMGDYRQAVEEFEKVERSLSKHALWYQIEPIEAYYELGNYDRMFALTDGILSGGNPAYAELYVLRGKSYLKEGDRAKAKEAFEKAVLYNKNLASATEALASLPAD